MIKLLTRAATAAVLLFVFYMASPASASGQAGVYRGRQGRKVGRVTLPTPPFNPNAGILESRGGRGQDSPRSTRRRRSTRRGVKAAGHATPRRRRVRRGRNPSPGTPRARVGSQR